MENPSQRRPLVGNESSSHAIRQHFCIGFRVGWRAGKETINRASPHGAEIPCICTASAASDGGGMHRIARRGDGWARIKNVVSPRLSLRESQEIQEARSLTLWFLVESPCTDDVAAQVTVVMVFQLPAAVDAEAVAVICYSFICFFSNILLGWLLWKHNDRTSCRLPIIFSLQ